MTHPTPPSWRVIDHTADTGIAIEAGTLPELFEQAAEGMFSLIAAPRPRRGGRVAAVSAAGLDWPDLMFQWLRTLLFVWTGEARMLSGVRVTAVEPYSIRGEIETEGYDPGVHTLGNDIKAVTYHQLRVEKTGGRWRAQAIFDV
jgi:SHS2 domain-containing protein